jgi:hypothetical protein
MMPAVMNEVIDKVGDLIVRIAIESLLLAKALPICLKDLAMSSDVYKRFPRSIIN